jgi:sulfur carrier protein ThiS
VIVQFWTRSGPGSAALRAASANEVALRERTSWPARSFFVFANRKHQRRLIVQTYEDTAVKVVYGVNELSLDLGGKSIRGIWKMLEQVLNLPRETTVSVNGQTVADDHIVRAGDEIEFLKPAGVKGLAG